MSTSVDRPGLSSGGAIFRLAIAARQDLHPFLAAHARPGLGADPRFLLELARGSDSVFDLHDPRGRVLVAVLTDACDNSGDAAELVLLACRDGRLGESTLAACLEAAIAEAVGGPRSSLEVVVADVVQPHRELLLAKGMRPRFEMVSMERAGPTNMETPPDAGWTDLRPHDVEALWALSRAAFRGHPGVNFPPRNRADIHLQRRSPAPRLLWRGARLLGSVSVRVDPGGLGVIETVQRHPDDAGRGLGPRLVGEALRVLADAGCDRVRLDASVENQRALDLYRRFGFAVTEITPVLGMPTPSVP